MKKLIIITASVGLLLVALAKAGSLNETAAQTYSQGADGFVNASKIFVITVNETNRFSGNFPVTNGGNTVISFPLVTHPGRVFGYDSSSNAAGNVRFSVDGTNWLEGAASLEPFSFRMVTNQSFIVVSVDSTNTHWINFNILSR